MKLSEKLEAMAHFAREQEAGEHLQTRSDEKSKWWGARLTEHQTPESFDPALWRVKPEPAVIYCNEYPDGYFPDVLFGSPASSSDAAKQKAGPSAIRTAVKFREVIK